MVVSTAPIRINGEAPVFTEDPITPPNIRLVKFDGEKPTAPNVIRHSPALFEETDLVATIRKRPRRAV